MSSAGETVRCLKGGRRQRCLDRAAGIRPLRQRRVGSSCSVSTVTCQGGSAGREARCSTDAEPGHGGGVSEGQGGVAGAWRVHREAQGRRRPEVHTTAGCVPARKGMTRCGCGERADLHRAVAAWGKKNTCEQLPGIDKGDRSASGAGRARSTCTRCSVNAYDEHPELGERVRSAPGSRRTRSICTRGAGRLSNQLPELGEIVRSAPRPRGTLAILTSGPRKMQRHAIRAGRTRSTRPGARRTRVASILVPRGRGRPSSRGEQRDVVSPTEGASDAAWEGGPEKTPSPPIYAVPLKLSGGTARLGPDPGMSEEWTVCSGMDQPVQAIRPPGQSPPSGWRSVPENWPSVSEGWVTPGLM